ncbi:MAG: bifunctional acetate--CoA ligase family protein/GNAT family N-acetyltransferase [Planctomycetaceae bacterium]|nr:bifunctional acetate--CoA ligase family protein/GNAT family N-acetyltransferase [Planctomycetaceae bacterium]
MTIYNLSRIFRPKSVAIIGASAKPGSVGATVLRNVIDGGFPGDIFPVNPKYESLCGLPCYFSIEAVPTTPDLAIVATPASTVPEVVRSCGHKQTQGLIILSAGFREAGAAGAALEAEVLRAAREFPGLRVIGPNCLGVIAPWSKLNASFAANMPQRGAVAFLSQSGALCTAALDRAMSDGLGFSYFVSVGNMIDVDLGDLIDYFAEDPAVRSMVMYSESITNARKFLSASRSFSATRPLVAYKAGRFATSAKAAASHTGAMAGEDAVVAAAFRRAGIERVLEIGNVFDCAEYLAKCRPPRRPQLAIVTNAGGPGVMSVDALLSRGGELATLSPSTLERLNALLPAYWSHGNPVDILGDAPPERYRDALRVVLGDDAVGAVLVILTPQAMTDPTAAGVAVAEVARTAKKPILAAWLGGRSVAEGVERLNAAGVATFATPEEAVETFLHLVSYADNLRALYETPRALPAANSLASPRFSEAIATCRTEGRTLLDEHESKQILEEAEIPVTTTRFARTAEEAVIAAREIGFPVAIKLVSPQITHKSDVGGVVLNVVSEAAVIEAFESIGHQARIKRPDAAVSGVTVQPMVRMPEAVELILGAKRDPVFGMVLMVGAGGTTAELFSDRALELVPVTERLARRMLESLKSWPLLNGYRGRPGVAHSPLIEAIVKFSDWIVAHPEVVECDINPLLAGPERTIALDARVVVDPTERGSKSSLSHLAIRPYPREYERQESLVDGTMVRLRPIRPEDEPRWIALLRSCSLETIRSRFRLSMSEPTHEMAVRYCFIDYDRELAIIAEGVGEGDRPMMGVGRLVSDPDHRTAEFAVLVADAWQGRGLGLLLTRTCVEIARSWGIRQIQAETDAGNHRMVSSFRESGWTLRPSKEVGRVIAELDLNLTKPD